MGLACSQIRLLTLTSRKNDCEYNINIASMEKIALAKEQTQLSQSYNSKLRATKLCYYQNGEFHKINYSYLMPPKFLGNKDFLVSLYKETLPFKTRNDMVLTDYTGRVVLDSKYAKAITEALGSSSILNGKGQGSAFSKDKIPEILAQLTGFNVDNIKKYIKNEMVFSDFANQSGGRTDNSEYFTEEQEYILNLYYPIILAAANNGWTIQYNSEIANSKDYVADSLVNGTFQLALVEENGQYDPDASLTYFTTAGYVQEKSDADAREEITAWYTAEKDKVSEKESMLDLTITDLSTELEAIKTEIQSLKQIISKDTESFKLA